MPIATDCQSVVVDHYAPLEFQLLADGTPYADKEGHSTWPVGGIKKLKHYLLQFRA